MTKRVRRQPSTELSWEDLAEIEAQNHPSAEGSVARANVDRLCSTIHEVCAERERLDVDLTRAVGLLRLSKPCCAQGLGVDCPQHGRAV